MIEPPSSDELDNLERATAPEGYTPPPWPSDENGDNPVFDFFTPQIIDYHSIAFQNLP